VKQRNKIMWKEHVKVPRQLLSASTVKSEARWNRGMGDKEMEKIIKSI